MFGRRFKLFRLLGFEVRADVSWLIVLVLISWSLAQSVLPSRFPNLSVAEYWGLGIAGALGLFLSIVIHEFSHSLVARRFGLPMKGITLFIFGGVAEMEEEPPSAKAELLMAIAGPATSVALAGAFYGISAAARSAGSPPGIVGVLDYLWSINLILAAFNLVPAFPLDGGRVLRAILWGWSKKIEWATKVASAFGNGFGLVLIAFGVFSFIRGDLFTGIWMFLIGMFLRSASQGSYQQLIVRHELQGQPVRRFMKEDPVTVPYQISVDRLVENYVYKHHYRMYPVVQGEQLVGCVTTQDIRNVPRESWDQHTVKEISSRCSSDNSVPPDMDAAEALQRMQKSGNTRLMVVESGHLVGILTLKDLLDFLSVRLSLGGARDGLASK